MSGVLRGFRLAHKIQEAFELTYRAFVSEVGEGYRNGERAIIKEIVYTNGLITLESHTLRNEKSITKLNKIAA